MESRCRFLNKLKIGLPWDPVIPLLGIHPKDFMFTAALCIIAKIWNQPEHPSTDEWIKTTGYTPSGVLFSHNE